MSWEPELNTHGVQRNQLSLTIKHATFSLFFTVTTSNVPRVRGDENRETQGQGMTQNNQANGYSHLFLQLCIIHWVGAPSYSIHVTERPAYTGNPAVQLFVPCISLAPCIFHLANSPLPSCLHSKPNISPCHSHLSCHTTMLKNTVYFVPPLCIGPS